MKNKISAIIGAMVMTVAIVFAGLTTALPAQADMGDDVFLAQVSSNQTGYLRTWNVNNWPKWIYIGETAQNVERVCPPGSGWTMIVTGQYSTRVLDPGECYWPINDISVELWNY